MVECCLVDGHAAGCLPIDDRGLAYGDGVFRTVRVVSGQADGWAFHVQRLAHDSRALAIDMPDEQTLLADSKRLFADGGSGVLKIILTRGSSGRGYTPATNTCRRIVTRHPLPAPMAAASLDLQLSPVVLGHQPLLAGVKHLNRLEQVLARADCQRRGLVDALMCDGESNMICTTQCNLLFVDDCGQWLTPALGRCGVAGATRARLMAATDIAETDIPVDAIPRLRAGVVCNSLRGVIPIGWLAHAGRCWPLAGSSEMAEACRRLLIIQ